MIHGGCACGAVQYEVSGELVDFKPEEHMLYITLGTVDGDIDCPAGFHQFAGSKAPWFEITDDLPQHDGWPVDTE